LWFNRRHDNVLRTLRIALERDCPPDFSALNFEEAKYDAAKGEDRLERGAGDVDNLGSRTGRAGRLRNFANSILSWLTRALARGEAPRPSKPIFRLCSYDESALPLQPAL
jgi:hypothetical protein